MIARPGTQDACMIAEVIDRNEYRLPLKISGTVIDIGANIGSFAIACLSRGADRVVCYEPCPDSFRLLVENTSAHGDRVVAHNKAVWRSDRDEKLAFVSRGELTACGFVIPDSQGDNSVSLDSIIREYSPISLLKIDAEAAEYPIIYTSRLLKKVPCIIGELHSVVIPPNTAVTASGMPVELFSADMMKIILEKRGFSVGVAPEGGPGGPNTLFWANRIGCLL